MDPFKPYFDQHKSSFDRLEPTEQHWESIEANLPQKRSTKVFPLWSKVAAVILLLITAFIIGWQSQQSNLELPVNPSASETDTNRIQNLADISEELAKVEYYYQSTIQKQMDEVAQYSVKEHPEIELFLKESSRLDSAYIGLLQEINQVGQHEKIIHALIQNYRFKTQLLEQLLETIQQTKKSSNHEKSA